jgi:hypothetical protein
MAKSPLKIRDPKLRKLLESLKKKPKKGAKTEPKRVGSSQSSTFYADKARALEAELRAMREGRMPSHHVAKKRAKKAVKRTATHALRVPSLPADHPFNRPRKASKKRAKKAVKRTATHALRVPSLPADHPFNRPRKSGKKRAKKAARKPKGPAHLPPELLRDLGFATPRKRAKKASKKRGTFHVKHAKKATKKRGPTSHVKPAKKPAKKVKSKRTTKRR